MGFRDNKVTRRVALGTIAAGMAGSAFVIKALKAKYQTPIPASPRYEEKFVTAWADSLKQIAIPSQKIAGPSSFSVKLNVPGLQFHGGGKRRNIGPDRLPLSFH